MLITYFTGRLSGTSSSRIRENDAISASSEHVIIKIGREGPVLLTIISLQFLLSYTIYL